MLAVMFFLVNETASAQLAGNPVYAVTPSVGVTLSVDYGRGLVVGESAKTDFFGGRLFMGFPGVSFWVGGGEYDSRTGAEKEKMLGGGVAFDFLRAPSSPVVLSLQVGAGTGDCGTDCTMTNAVAGPALKINVVGAVNTIQPWLMPRVQATRFSMSGAVVNQFGFGGSAGINLTLPFGLGIHSALDYSTFRETTTGAMTAVRREPLIVGGGLHYFLSIPGFGTLMR
jgi:hypothetical protein